MSLNSRAEHFRFGPVLNQNKQPNCFFFFFLVFEPIRIENRFKPINFGSVRFGFFPFQTGLNRLKLNNTTQGIESPSKDLETVKHILEALQLKCLLRFKKPTNQTNQRNFAYEETPVVLMKPALMNRLMEDWKIKREEDRIEGVNIQDG
jgi:hypothetical protein